MKIIFDFYIIAIIIYAIHYNLLHAHLAPVYSKVDRVAFLIMRTELTVRQLAYQQYLFTFLQHKNDDQRREEQSDTLELTNASLAALKGNL